MTKYSILSTDNVTAPRVKTLKSGKRVIVDPSYTIARMYTWLFLFTNFGALTGQIGMIYASKYAGFWLAYALPTISISLCPIILWTGRTSYIRFPPQQMVLGTLMRIWGQGLEGIWNANPVQLYRNWTSPTFWDRARPDAVVAANNGTVPGWLSYDSNYVDQVRRGLKACQVFLFLPLYWLSFDQINSSESPSHLYLSSCVSRAWMRASSAKRDVILYWLFHGTVGR